MDTENGQITQPVPPDDNTPNPNGTWGIRLTMQDAFDVGSPTGDYSWLFDFQDVTITLGYPAVNLTALSDVCVIAQYAGTNGPYSESNLEPNQAITTPPSPSNFPGGGTTLSPTVTGCWYLGSQQLNNVDLPPVYSNVANVSNEEVSGAQRFFNKSYKIGGVTGEAHKSGTKLLSE